jgi:hypothetical protein
MYELVESGEVHLERGHGVSAVVAHDVQVVGCVCVCFRGEYPEEQGVVQFIVVWRSWCVCVCVWVGVGVCVCGCWCVCVWVWV